MSGDRDETLKQLTETIWFGIGRRSAAAFACNHEWLFRRVEAIEFVDRRSVRRKVSVDFEVPRKLPGLGKRAARNAVLVPIAVLQKWPPLMDFHLSDQTNQSISRYLRTTNKQLDFGLLLGMTDLTLAHGDSQAEKTSWEMRRRFSRRLGWPEPERLDSGLRQRLAAIVQDPQPQQTDVANAVNELSSELEGRLKEALDRERFRDSTRIATQVAVTVDLAARLAGGSILWVPVRGRPGTDRIVKFSYLGPYHGSSPEFLEDLGKQDRKWGIRTRTSERLKRVAISCSWRRRTLTIPLLHAGRQVRYHLDVCAPEGSVEILEAKALALPAATGDGARDAPVRSVPSLARKYAGLDPPDEWVGSESDGYYMDYGEPLPLASTSPTPEGYGKLPAESETEASAEIIDRRAHVYLGITGAPSHRVLLQVKLAAARQGFIQGCATAATVIAFMMWFAFAQLGSAAIHIEPTVVLLSVVPIVLGYVLVRPDEQPFEHYHLSGVRVMALLSGATPIVGALLLVLTHKGPASDTSPDLAVVRPIWLALAVVSALTAAGLILSWFRAAPSKDPGDGAAKSDFLPSA
jgi:hypothetical protein